MDIKKLGLGTAQWGLPYGLTNQGGVVAPETIAEILNEARHNEIRVLDTASLYGDAETVLGSNFLESFRLVTKTPKFMTSVITEEHAQQLIQTFYQSLERLSCQKIYGLLIHHAPNLLVTGGEKLATAVIKLKEECAVEKIGVSVYDGEQIDDILKVFKPDIVQLPLSVLDQRMLIGGHLQRLKDEGVEIHVRSVFLQGLLLMPLEMVPSYFDPIRPLLMQWHKCANLQGMSLVQAALTFVREIPYVDTVLVGIHSMSQFQACIENFSVKASFDASNLACNESEYVNPALWRI